MSGRNGDGSEAVASDTARVFSSWLVDGEIERQRLLDMDRRLRPVRLRTFGVLAVALAAAAPWVGWWTLGALVLAAAVFRISEVRIDRTARPEYWMLAAWVGAEAIIAASLALTGEAGVMMLSLLAIPVVTLSARFSTRGVVGGVLIAAALVLAVAFGTSADAVLAEPPLLTVPLTMIVAVAMLSTALMWSDREHRDKARIDPVTGLLNRASLESRIVEVEQQSLVTRAPVGVLVLDVDDFKAVNDRDGHLAGDGVLAEVANVLRRELRAFDAAFRSGGDEFVVLVPGADRDAARIVGVKLHSAVNVVLRAECGGVTVSCGASASVAGEPFVFSRVFRCADRAMYRAKAEGHGFGSEGSGRSLIVGSGSEG